MRILGIAVAASIVSSLAVTAVAQPLSDADREAVVQEVIRRIVADPSALAAALEARRDREAAVPAAPVPVSGNPSGDVTVFEFADYGCDPCRKAAASLDQAAAADGGIRIVHHDYPASGVNAAAASSDLLEAWLTGSDWAALRRSYVDAGVAPEDRIKALATAGIELDGEVREEAIRTIVANRSLAIRAGVAELPAVIVARGDKVIPLAGDITAEAILAAAGRLRSPDLGQP